ncbi:MAG: ArsR family transcriptional regulator [Bacteroidetes bacterium]|nr:ArsR family transcriptional regulator [Bacteroidota bacterium]
MSFNKPQPVQKLPPVWLIKAINSFRTFLLQLNRKLFPGNVVLYEQFQYFWLLPSLYVAAKLDIATLLKKKPLTVHEMADLLHVDASNISRIMRALASQGIFRQLKDDRYALNGLSKPLLEEQGSLRYMILHHLGAVNWNLMSNLEVAVKTGMDPFKERYGAGIYEYLKDHPPDYELFDKSMSNLSELGLSPILNAYDFSKYPVIADIGGGEGFLLANILNNNPGSKGILFDTTQGVAKAPEILAVNHSLNRTTVIAGDFFKSITVEANIYILKNIIHNWNDEDCLIILSNISKCMLTDSRLLIIEMVVPPGNTPSLSKLLDIQMMAAMQGGKERTAAEFETLLEKSGFTLPKIIPTIAPICLIEANKR